MVFTGIGVFVDLENFGGKVPVQQILATLLTHGPVLVRRAYGNIQTVESKNLDALSEEGFEIFHTHPTNNVSMKNSSDIRMVLDVLDCAVRCPCINMITLVSGDSDMLPLVGKLRERNIQVWGFANRLSCNHLLVKQMDNFEFLPFDTRRLSTGPSSVPPPATTTPTETAAVEEATADVVLDVVVDVVRELLGKNEKAAMAKILDAIRRRCPEWVKPKGRFKYFLKDVFRQRNMVHYIIENGYVLDSSTR